MEQRYKNKAIAIWVCYRRGNVWLHIRLLGIVFPASDVDCKHNKLQKDYLFKDYTCLCLVCHIFRKNKKLISIIYSLLQNLGTIIPASESMAYLYKEQTMGYSFMLRMFCLKNKQISFSHPNIGCM